MRKLLKALIFLCLLAVVGGIFYSLFSKEKSVLIWVFSAGILDVFLALWLSLLPKRRNRNNPVLCHYCNCQAAYRCRICSRPICPKHAKFPKDSAGEYVAFQRILWVCPEHEIFEES